MADYSEVARLDREGREAGVRGRGKDQRRPTSATIYRWRMCATSTNCSMDACSSA